MKFPFVKESPVFLPRKRIAERVDLTETERAILDAIDVLQQKADFAVETVVNTWNLVVLLAVLTIAINGAQIAKIFQSWIAPDYRGGRRAGALTDVPAVAPTQALAAPVAGGSVR